MPLCFSTSDSTLAPQIALRLLRLPRFFYVCGNLFRRKHQQIRNERQRGLLVVDILLRLKIPGLSHRFEDKILRPSGELPLPKKMSYSASLMQQRISSCSTDSYLIRHGGNADLLRSCTPESACKQHCSLPYVFFEAQFWKCVCFWWQVWLINYPFFFQALKLNMHQRGKPQRGLSRYVSQTTPTSLKMSAFAAGPPRLHGKYFGVKSWRKVNSWCVEVEKERFDTTSLRTCIFYSLHRVTLSQLRVLQFPTASSKLWLNYNAAEDKLSAGKIGKLIAYKLQVGMSSSGVLKLTQHFRCSVSVLNLHTFLMLTVVL